MNKKILLLIALVFISAGALIFYGLYQSSKNKELTASIALEVVPDGAKSTINGRGVREGTTKLKPGVAEIIISKKGFETIKQTVVLKDGEPRYFGFALVSNSASTADWYDKHPEDAKKAEGISSRNYDESSAMASQQEPFLMELPYISGDEEFRIDYGLRLSADNQATIYISANTQEAKNAALLWIKSLGYDPSKMNIVYRPKN